MSRRTLLLLVIFSFLTPSAFSQTDSLRIPSGFFDVIQSKIEKTENKLDKQTAKALLKFKRIETKLMKNLKSCGVVCDSLGDINNHYYDPYTDTLLSTLHFLQQYNNSCANLSSGLRLKNLSEKLDVLNTKMRKADALKQSMRERTQKLRQELEKMGMLSKLKKLEKTAYYYAAFIDEYKTIFRDKKKLERKVMSMLYSFEPFKKFVAEHSMLSGLFKLPGESFGALPMLAGVQTRITVQQNMQSAISGGGPNAVAMIQQQVRAAQDELGKLKEKIYKYGSAESEQLHFKPNTQKTKSFSQRIEYGVNLQFGRANKYLPSSADIALMLGYKINGNVVIGVGASYRFSISDNQRNFHLSNAGVGLRSYADWRLAGKFYVSAGYEQNYNNAFGTIEQLKKYSAWQSSGLVGITKKIRWRQKAVKIQLLYDFLYSNHLPFSQPFVFRTGFSFK